MTDPNPDDRTNPPAADEDATETSGAGYGNHPDETENKPAQK